MADDAEDWTEVTWSEGTKGPLSGRFHRQRVRVVSNTQRRWVSEEERWLLLEDKGDEIKAWLCRGVDEWSLEELATYAHVRWPIEPSSMAASLEGLCPLQRLIEQCRWQKGFGWLPSSRPKVNLRLDHLPDLEP